MPLLPETLDFNDPSIDTTRDYCGNSLFVDEARKYYTSAFSRVMEYVYSEQISGDVMEFGSYSGFTSRILAEAMRKYNHKGGLHLFDSFEGFPSSNAAEDNNSCKVAVQGYWQPGELSAPAGIEQHIFNRLSPILPDGKLYVHKGFFNNTLPRVAAGRKVSVVHIDSDLYASAKYILDALSQAKAFNDGTVVIFDDFFCNRANPNFGEQAALRDFLKENPRFVFNKWFTYGWGSAVFFFHDTKINSQVAAECS